MPQKADVGKFDTTAELNRRGGWRKSGRSTQRRYRILYVPGGEEGEEASAPWGGAVKGSDTVNKSCKLKDYLSGLPSKERCPVHIGSSSPLC